MGDESKIIDGGVVAGTENEDTNKAGEGSQETAESKLEAKTEPEKAFTQADIDAAVNAAVGSAVEKAFEKWEAKKSEAEKLANMTEDQKIQVENKKERAELEKMRAELEYDQLLAEAAKQLKASGVPESFAARVCGKNAEETKANIDAFVSEWNAAVKTGVEEKLKGKAPKSGGSETSADAMRAIIQKNIMKGF